MSVQNGQLANQTTFNSAFLSRKIDTDTLGKISLLQPASGGLITNAQQALNNIFDAVGMTDENDANRKIYSSNFILVDGQAYKQSIENIDSYLSTLSVDAKKLVQFISDGAYETAHGAPTGGELYYNTTTGKVRYYDSVEASWRNLGSDLLGIQEVPAGITNGVNTDFTILNAPNDEGSLQVFENGRIVETSRYSYSGGTITFTVAPASGTELYAWYISDGTPNSPIIPTGTNVVIYDTISAGEEISKSFTLVSTPAQPTMVLFDIIGGTSQHYGVDFTISGNTLSWSGLDLDGVLTENDVVRLQYFT